MAKKKAKEIPEEEKPRQSQLLILGVCICQFAMVLSIVSFIYLSVAIYVPSHRMYTSSYETTPVTCQTTELIMAQNCSWASCGEWCLTKTSGFCPQIFVTVRQPATDIVLENCSRISTNSCPQVSFESFKQFNCNNGSECSTLTGLFNCSLGHCGNMSELLLCHYKADGPTIDSEKDNNKLTGFFECYKSRCTKIKKPFSCERRSCPKITTTGFNVYLMYDDAVYSGDCVRAVTNMAANSNSPPKLIPTTEIWHEKSETALLASCGKVWPVKTATGTNLVATDCLDGSTKPINDVPTPFMNFTTFWTEYDKSPRPFEPTNTFLPIIKNISIYEGAKLFINLDGCVNTLRGECKEFTDQNGKDGKNRTAVSRFPCFYDKNNNKTALARHDLEKTRRELLIALLVPSVMFAVSFTTLLVVVRTVAVDENHILRCRWFRGRTSPEVQTQEEKIALHVRQPTEPE